MTIHPRDHDDGEHPVAVRLSDVGNPDQECPSCIGTMGSHEEECILGLLNTTPEGLLMERAYRRGVQQALFLAHARLVEMKEEGLTSSDVLAVLCRMAHEAGGMRYDMTEKYPLYLHTLLARISEEVKP